MRFYMNSKYGHTNPNFEEYPDLNDNMKAGTNNLFFGMQKISL